MSSASWFKVIKDLLPPGRAFRLPFENDLYKFHKASAEEPNRICTLYTQVRDSGIPTDELTADALDEWELYLGLQKNSNLTTDERRERIIGKYYSVGGQGPDYIQERLQSAGFPVFLYENNPTAGARQYTVLLGDTGIQMGDFVLGDFTDRIDPRTLGGFLYASPPVWESRRDYIGSQLDDTNIEMNDFELGEFASVVIDEAPYLIPSDSSIYIFFWFLAGPGGIFDFVDIPADRRTDFESLIYQLKPAHTWVIAQVNYI